MPEQDPKKGAKEGQQDESEGWSSLRHPGPIPEVLREKPAAPKPRDTSDMQSRMAKMGAIGTNFMVSVVAAGLLGWLIDRWQGTKPWCLLGGLILGLVYGFYKFIKEAMAATRQPPR